MSDKNDVVPRKFSRKIISSGELDRRSLNNVSMHNHGSTGNPFQNEIQIIF